MKEYYGAKDIQKITDCSQAKAYSIIRQIQDKFYKEYPDVIPIQGKVPIWYFEKIMMNKEKRN